LSLRIKSQGQRDAWEVSDVSKVEALKPKSLPRATRRSKVVAEDHKEAKVVAEGHKEAKVVPEGYANTYVKEEELKLVFLFMTPQTALWVCVFICVLEYIVYGIRLL
jgi:hypothetical protein